jgi:hypothetical protein
MEEHLHILKRVGKVLITVGVLDIGVMIYCIANGISHSSSLNIFAVIAGFFLIRGSLRAAAVVAWLAALFVVVVAGIPFASLLVQPLELSYLQFRLDPGVFTLTAIMWLFSLGLFYWVITELRSKPILSAQEKAGKRAVSLPVPLTLGVLLLVILAVTVPMGLNSESGRLALAKAKEQLGPDYKYVVSSIHVITSQQGKSVTATVTAYNNHEIRTVPVKWSEK